MNGFRVADTTVKNLRISIFYQNFATIALFKDPLSHYGGTDETSDIFPYLEK